MTHVRAAAAVALLIGAAGGQGAAHGHRQAARVTDAAGPAQSGNPTMTRRVYVVVYDPLLSSGKLLSEHFGWAKHADMTRANIDFMRDVSHGQLQYTVAETTVLSDGWPEKIDGFRYTEEEYLAVVGGSAPAHSPDWVDYNKIVNDPRLDICGKANGGLIDEVWLYNGPAFGFYESRLVGPRAYWLNAPPLGQPHNCERLIALMGPNPERPDQLGHGEGHRMESAMTKVVGGWQQNRTANDWERFSLVKALSPAFDYSGCGNVHYPPNGSSDYDYTNTAVVSSTCADFDNYPNLGDPSDTAELMSCAAWGCNEVGYMRYWFGHLPSGPGCGPNRLAHNWWWYYAYPEYALDGPPACAGMVPPTPTPFPRPTRGPDIDDDPVLVPADARRPWQGTGARYQAGASAVIEVADGEWTNWVGTNEPNPGTGSGYVCGRVLPPDTCSEPVPMEPAGALVGRVGGWLFGIGEGREQVTESHGDLALRINDADDGLYDNDGVLWVRTGVESVVAATEGWQATGLSVEGGSPLLIEVRAGEWAHSAEVASNPGTGGGYVCADIMPEELCAEPLPAAPTGSLVGRIGVAVTPIGPHARLTAPATGTIWLRINEQDAGLGDNVGQLTVRAWVGLPPAARLYLPQGEKWSP